MSDAVVPQPTKTARAGAGWFRRMLDSDLLYSFRRSKLTMLAAAVTALFFLLAIFASVLAVQNPFDPAQLQLTSRAATSSPPSSTACAFRSSSACSA
jgi:peptide/nickel transport system permease protein